MLTKEYGILLLAPVVLELVGLCFVVWVDPYISRRHRQVMLIIVALNFCLIAQNVIECALRFRLMPELRTFISILGYSVRPLILLMFFCLVSDRKSHWAGWVLTALNALVHLTALFSPVCFSIDATNFFRRGPLGYTCHAVSALLLLEIVCLSVKKSREQRGSQIWIPLINAALIVVAAVLDSVLTFENYPLTLLTIAVVSASLFYYIWLHLQFAREHERDLQAEQRIRIMMTQIQPHFLYNTIATVRALCRTDPEKAAEVAEKFGLYLRQNLDSLDTTELIPFEKELAHTRLYAEIEMVRFENVRVEYDIQDGGFSVPALTIQPLVENAIRHGVRVRERGIVRILARRTERGHEIVVEDNGRGFDTEQLAGLDERHIGIRNVRGRLEKSCGGTFSIDSRIDGGTTVTIVIPAET